MVAAGAHRGVSEQAKLLGGIQSVQEGQPMRCYAETLHRDEHGIVEGRVERIGRDSETDEALGLVYPVRVTIGTDGPADALSRQLMPGMAVQAEVVTDRRRVIEYLFSPIERTVRTAGRER